MAAHFDAIQQQHRHVQPITPLQLRIGVRIQALHRWQRQAVAQRDQRLVHFIAQIAAVATDQRQSECGRDGNQRRLPPAGPGPPLMEGALGAGRGVFDSIELAMARTVSGGTSPMAVTR
jgi:hypothetical protein